jgi:lipopolysaccharide export system permease protein
MLPQPRLTTYRTAFTAGYPRTNKLGRTVLYGKYLGFVVYLATELGHRLRLSGRLGSAPAGTPPVHAAIGVGLTVLRFKEDGRT